MRVKYSNMPGFLLPRFLLNSLHTLASAQHSLFPQQGGQRETDRNANEMTCYDALKNAASLQVAMTILWMKHPYKLLRQPCECSILMGPIRPSMSCVSPPLLGLISDHFWPWHCLFNTCSLLKSIEHSNHTPSLGLEVAVLCLDISFSINRVCLFPHCVKRLPKTFLASFPLT